MVVGITTTAAHTVLVLPLEQFILNAFEKTPARDQRERETHTHRPTAEKRGTERGGRRKTVKAHGQARQSSRKSEKK